MSTDALLQHLNAFVGFVRARTGDPELAADLVQECLLKALRADKIPEDDEGTVTWFYRILRHAIIDAHRRSTTRNKLAEAFSREPPESPGVNERDAVCHCVMKLLPALSKNDAELLRRVDLEGESVTEIARATDQRVNTLNVRLLRARLRLREQVEQVCRTCATHGCLDCDCP
ncbi:N/A [soil metagenome]